ncbi:MAG: NusG domain II-containing protein [Hungatella sp.]|nr:NusG domain II-containing protein [Hungatella sp.]
MKNILKDKTAIRDIVLVILLVVLAGGMYIGNQIMNRKPAVIVEVSVDGVVVEELDLSKDTEFVVKGYQGGTNTLVIENGQVYITDATCPDKVCIHQGKINRSGEMIVCLPNLMIAKIVGEEE